MSVRLAGGDRCIRLRGVRVHNLQGIDLDLPRGELVVLTGVSGSGKSSLAFDTLYAEGQRRYIETFSAYTRQYLDALDKPEADRIEGIPPAIAVAQRLARRSGRSTVGTVTEIHDHLALLYARLGRVICLTCRTEVRPADPSQVVATIEALPPRTRYQIAFPIDLTPETNRAALADALRGGGFIRVRVDGVTRVLESGPLPEPSTGTSVEVVVDRLVRGSEDPSRRLDSIETAFSKGLGRCRLLVDAAEGDRTFYRGWRCATCGADYLRPEPRLFRFNNPFGACPTCEGFGRLVDIDLDRVVPNPSLSLRDGALAPWSVARHRQWLDTLLAAAPGLGLPTDQPFRDLLPEQVRVVVEGGPGYPGLRAFLRTLERRSSPAHDRMWHRHGHADRPCPACRGARLRPEARAVELGGLNVARLGALPASESLAFLDTLVEADAPVARRVLEPLRRRLAILCEIGVGYLTLDRPARTLSLGESRRVALTTALGSGLVNTLYVLDEPTSGLHPRDVDQLVKSLRNLRHAGNTVVVVEHDRTVMLAADRLVDIGPGAGGAGGRVLYNGPPAGIVDCQGSLTGDFLAGRRRVAIPASRRLATRGRIELLGAAGRNLKGIDARFPLGVLCVVSGVSGAGKSAMIEETLYPAVARRLGGEAPPALPYRELRGVGDLAAVAMIDQSPIGRTPRSNPLTYVKAFDEIRKTFAATHESRVRNYAPGTFSFNTPGGRCEACEGNGHQVIDMRFLPDVLIRCPECRGTRYRPEVLEVTYRGKSIAETLDLTVREAFGHFKNRPKIQAKLRPLIDVGLDYLRLGQPTSTLSGGEAQRLRLAGFLASSAAAVTRQAAGPKTLFLLDEPTAGLHPADVLVLLDALHRLIDVGHSIIVVEHRLEFLAAADWILDLGPEAGDRGGEIVAEGTPEHVSRCETATGAVLEAYFRTLGP